MIINFNYNKEFKPIPNYEHYIINKKGVIINTITGVKLKQHINTHGYLKVSLCKNGKAKTFCVHSIVGKLFLPNPFNYNVINHKDENKLNNDVENLEWCDTKYNHNYGNALIKNGKAHRKPITARNGIDKIIVDSFKTFTEFMNVKTVISNYIDTGYKCKGYYISYSTKEEIELLGDRELIKLTQND